MFIQSNPLKHVVDEMLAKHGLTEAFEQSAEFHLRLERDCFLPLVVEHLDDVISIAHYGEQNGDAMRDPEMTFRSGSWEPMSFQQDYVGYYTEVYREVDGQHVPKLGLRQELLEFAAMWARNIREQGWLGDDVKATSLTHQHLLDAARSRVINASGPDSHLEQAYEDRNGGDYGSGE